MVLGKQGIDLSGYGRIELNTDHIEVSSIHKSFGKEYLIKESGFWHTEASNEAWVVIDMVNERKIDTIAIRPRRGCFSQLWEGETAILEGSNDQQEWNPQVKLELNHEELNDYGLIAFVLPEDMVRYRYYRLFIIDPGFYSIDELRIYE